MVVNKRSKRSRARGSWTHGRGEKKKHRGSGNKGGVGMAGTGKRADSKKPSIWKYDYFGKRGFVPKGVKKEINAINLAFLQRNIDNFVSKGLVNEEKGAYNVDLKALGYNKLLGSGAVKKKFKITADFASKKAIKSVKSAGGEVILKSDKKEGVNGTQRYFNESS